DTVDAPLNRRPGRDRAERRALLHRRALGIEHETRAVRGVSDRQRRVAPAPHAVLRTIEGLRLHETVDACPALDRGWIPHLPPAAFAPVPGAELAWAGSRREDLVLVRAIGAGQHSRQRADLAAS